MHSSINYYYVNGKDVLFFFNINALRALLLKV